MSRPSQIVMWRTSRLSYNIMHTILDVEELSLITTVDDQALLRDYYSFLINEVIDLILVIDIPFI